MDFDEDSVYGFIYPNDVVCHAHRIINQITTIYAQRDSCNPDGRDVLLVAQFNTQSLASFINPQLNRVERHQSLFSLFTRIERRHSFVFCTVMSLGFNQRCDLNVMTAPIPNLRQV